MLNTLRRFTPASRGSCRSLVISLGAVPEQVNIPIHRLTESRVLERQGIQLRFVRVPEGTGAIIEKLSKGELDLALPVTDGLIAGIAKGRNAEIAGTYVKSPLTWAVSVAPGSKFSQISDLNGKRIGVSRLGSGSHTMSFYMAMRHALDPAALQFVVANDFTGLREGVRNGVLDAFLWETFTTKPYHVDGTLRKIGDIATPWPAFAFACNPDALPSIKAAAIHEVLFPELARICAEFQHDEENSIKRIVAEHKHTQEDAALWLRSTIYSSDFSVDTASTADAVRVLQSAGVVPPDFDLRTLWAKNEVISFHQSTSVPAAAMS